MARKVRIPPIVYILVVATVGWGGYRYWQQQGIPDWVNLPGWVNRPGWMNRSTAVVPPAADTDGWLLLGDTFSGYSTFRNAEFQAALQEIGIPLRYDDEFDQAERAERLNRGEADLLLTSLDQFLQQQPQGQIIALIDRTIGADAVVLNTVKYPGLTSLLVLDQLVSAQRAQGNRLIATYAGDTPSEYLALVLDTKFDTFRLADFDVSQVGDASEAWDLLQDRAQPVGLAVLWEPYVTQARLRGYTVMLSSRDAPDTIVDVLVASDSLIQEDPDALSDLVEAYYRRIDANVRDASQLQAQIAEDGDLTPDEAAAVLQGIEFFTATEAQSWLNDGTLERRIQSTAAVLALSGRLGSVPEQPQALLTNTFVSRAARNNQTLIELVRADNPDLADRLAGRTRAITPILTDSQIQAAPTIGNLEVRGEVQFATGSAQLTSQGSTTLDQLLSEINEFSPQTVAVRVIGHTSRTGPADFNQALSQQRAQVVVGYLRERGLPHNVVAEGRGFELPLPELDPADARNQRTEIRLVRVE